ncbi:hypothetical protein ABFX02_11G038000 [Erythranthe guttata]
MEGPSMVNSKSKEEEDDDLALPPGFRFHPTDEEIIMQYLLNKVIDRRFVARAIGEADLNKCEPWDLPKKAKMGEKEWFFFCQRDRKYPTGTRTNRATESGYWKATGKDKEIYKTRSKNHLVGMKKTLVFYKGRAPKGDKTNWVMHEYRLEGNFSDYNFSRAAKEEFVVSRVFHKSTGVRRNPGDELARIDHGPTLPPLTDYNPSSDYYQTNDYYKKDVIASSPSSSRAFLENHKLEMQYDPKNFVVPPHQNYTNPIFYTQNTLPSSMFPYQAPTPSSSSLANYNHYQDGLISYPNNIFPFKGGDYYYNNQANNSRLVAPKMEQYFSSNNSVISHSQDTGISTENINNAVEINSVHSSKGDVESKKVFDQELEGLEFSPSNIPDFDSFWNN